MSGRPAAALLTGLGCLALAAGCGGSTYHRRASAPKSPPAPEASPAGTVAPAFGITEDNANVLWSPTAQAPAAADHFLAARRAFSALHPRYIRLLVDWAALQPSPRQPAALSASVDGCARGLAPCGAYDGLAGELAAVASEQRAARAAALPAPEVVIDILAAPAWAALPAHGCETATTTASARPIAPGSLAAYRALIAQLVALGAREGVALHWWSPWNEPNDPRFLSPQREACAEAAPPAAPAVYTQLARAMSAELKAVDPAARMLLGELGGYEDGSPHRLSLAEFVSALPADVLCLTDTWAVHAYAARPPATSGQDPVAALEAALDARGGCAASANIWVTEAGAGAPQPGRPRSGAPGEEAGACRALADQLLAWRADPRVEAVFQYEFRDDPAYPVGLDSADLGRLNADYGLWMRFERGPQNGEESTPGGLCGA